MSVALAEADPELPTDGSNDSILTGCLLAVETVVDDEEDIDVSEMLRRCNFKVDFSTFPGRPLRDSLEKLVVKREQVESEHERIKVLSGKLKNGP